MDATGIREKRNELVSQKVIKNLQKRHMQAYYADTREEALKIALSLIPEGCSVGWGGSISIQDVGIKDAIKQGKYTVVDRESAKNPEERFDLMRQCMSTDVFLMGTNAISEDGQLVNLDGLGNRVAALCFGPRSVIVIAGINKLVKTLDDAISRTRNYAAPVNLQRFENNKTGCRETGSCTDCTMEGCLCSQLVITRNCFPANRIKVILVGEELGF